MVLFVKAPLIVSDTGFFNLQIELPQGIEWDSSCIPIIDGNPPLTFWQENYPSTVKYNFRYTEKTSINLYKSN